MDGYAGHASHVQSCAVNAKLVQVMCWSIFKMANPYMNEWLIYWNRNMPRVGDNGGNGDVRLKKSRVHT